MPWPQQIERWRQYVSWECKDVSPDLILAIIKKESWGTPGLVASASCKPWPIPLASGGEITYNHALGLMQVVPRTLASYNNAHPGNIVYYEDMKGQDERSARLQIRVGCFTLAKAVNRLHGFYPDVFPAVTPGNATEEQLKLAIVGYRMGMRALKKKLDKLVAMGRPLTYEELQSSFPNWGGDVNRVYFYTSTVWNNALDNGMVPGGQLPPYDPGPSIPEQPGPPQSQIAGIGVIPWLLLIGAAVWLRKKFIEYYDE